MGNYKYGPNPAAKNEAGIKNQRNPTSRDFAAKIMTTVNWSTIDWECRVARNYVSTEKERTYVFANFWDNYKEDFEPRISLTDFISGMWYIYDTYKVGYGK